MKSINVTIPGRMQMQIAGGETLRAVAAAAGLEADLCAAGNCGRCKLRLLKGNAPMDRPWNVARLSGAEVAAGVVLSCIARPEADCVVTTDVNSGLAPLPLRRFMARVVSVDDLTHDIKRVRISGDPLGCLAFAAGQFASVGFPGQPMRDYSLALSPEEARQNNGVLEFHIRRMAGGRASAFVADHLQPGDEVRFEGPLGQAFLRDEPERPLILCAGGSGLAPMFAIARSAVARNWKAPVVLYAGFRTAADAYLTAELDDMEGEKFRHVAVLSEEKQETGGWKTGYLHEVLAQNFDGKDSLAGHVAYLAGPPVMVEATARVLASKGVSVEDIHADAFFSQAEMAARGIPGYRADQS